MFSGVFDASAPSGWRSAARRRYALRASLGSDQPPCRLRRDHHSALSCLQEVGGGQATPHFSGFIEGEDDLIVLRGTASEFQIIAGYCHI